jgi:hypothetical protein
MSRTTFSHEKNEMLRKNGSVDIQKKEKKNKTKKENEQK